MTTLAEALASGQGIERPISCPSPDHDDRHASASVNVLKMVWFCYACMARGSAGKGKSPSPADLAAMLEPEAAVRVYPEGWLDLHTSDQRYWRTRFAPWVPWALRMGTDPFSGDATFPVRTPDGLLAGVGRRRADPGDGPRYVYPRRWAASRSLFGFADVSPGQPVVIVEGAADAAAVIEVGCPAVAAYGSGLHLPQRELIARLKPRLILLGQDADAPGERGAAAAAEQLGDLAEVVRVDWTLNNRTAKDPGELSLGERLASLTESVRATTYGRQANEVQAAWLSAVARQETTYERFLEEESA